MYGSNPSFSCENQSSSRTTSSPRVSNNASEANNQEGQRTGGGGVSHWCHSCGVYLPANLVSEQPGGDTLCHICNMSGFVETIHRTDDTGTFHLRYHLPHTMDSRVRNLEVNIPASLQEFLASFFHLEVDSLSNLADSFMFPYEIARGLQQNHARTSPQFIDNLKKEYLTPEEARLAGPCAICQEEYVEDEPVYRLSQDRSLCAHVFHCDCILPWIHEHNSCPVCRFELPACEEDNRGGFLFQDDPRSTINIVPLINQPASSFSYRNTEPTQASAGTSNASNNLASSSSQSSPSFSSPFSSSASLLIPTASISQRPSVLSFSSSYSSAPFHSSSSSLHSSSSPSHSSATPLSHSSSSSPPCAASSPLHFSFSRSSSSSFPSRFVSSSRSPKYVPTKASRTTASNHPSSSSSSAPTSNAFPRNQSSPAERIMPFRAFSLLRRTYVSNNANTAFSADGTRRPYMLAHSFPSSFALSTSAANSGDSSRPRSTTQSGSATQPTSSTHRIARSQVNSVEEINGDFYQDFANIFSAINSLVDVPRESPSYSHRRVRARQVTSEFPFSRHSGGNRFSNSSRTGLFDQRIGEYRLRYLGLNSGTQGSRGSHPGTFTTRTTIVFPPSPE